MGRARGQQHDAAQSFDAVLGARRGLARTVTSIDDDGLRRSALAASREFQTLDIDGVGPTEVKLACEPSVGWVGRSGPHGQFVTFRLRLYVTADGAHWVPTLTYDDPDRATGRFGADTLGAFPDIVSAVDAYTQAFERLQGERSWQTPLSETSSKPRRPGAAPDTRMSVEFVTHSRLR